MSQALFPGWRPSDDEAARLVPIAAALRDASREYALELESLRRPDQWHVTLCFIGSGVRHLVTPALLASFERAAAGIPPHSFRMERIAYWRSGVVVALPVGCPELQALCDATRAACNPDRHAHPARSSRLKPLPQKKRGRSWERLQPRAFHGKGA